MGGVPREAQAGVQPRYDMEARLGQVQAGETWCFLSSLAPGLRPKDSPPQSLKKPQPVVAAADTGRETGPVAGGQGHGPQATPRTGRTSLRDPQVAQSIFGS